MNGDRVQTAPGERREGSTPMAAPREALPADGPRAPFELTIEQNAATFLLHLTGEFDLAAIGRVEAALDSRPKALTRHVVFDLRHVSFLDLAGLMTLIRADKRSRTEAFDVQVVAPRGLASRVFTLTRAGMQLTMVDAIPHPAPSYGHASS